MPFAACVCIAQETGASTAKSAEEEVIVLDDAWVAAEVDGDRNVLDHILIDDFLATLGSGKTIDRNAYIDYILSKDIQPFTVVHNTIRVHGDTALIIDLSESGKTKFT